MPRPGPRPYECVRRAWHSDRHQPMRGTIIQEIFRVVSDGHSSLTKKNKEWQEKLPVVVLKAEEIMYSKANSEAEYMDVKTLWDRLNDAIDTIIRREEGTESGDFLQPCIEAALILGCTVRRASRSQRNSNPRCYLSPNKQEPPSLPPRVPDNITHVGGSSHMQPHPSVNPNSNPQFMSYHSNFPRSMTPTTNFLGRESCSGAAIDQHHPIHQGVPLSLQAPVQHVDNENFRESANHSLNFGRVYPLYDVTHHEIIRPQFSFQTPHHLHPNAATLDMRRIQPNVEAPVKGVLQNLFPEDQPVNALNRTNQVSMTSKPSEINCDLSLRLGIQSASSTGAGTSGRQGVEFENMQSSNSQEYCFFPGRSAHETLDSSRERGFEGGEGLHFESSSSRKRKETVRSSDEDAHFPQQRIFPPDLFLGKMKRPDK